MYASTIGTFLQRDPLALGANTTLGYSHTSISRLLRNLLNYVGSRPVDAVDPEGLDPNSFPGFVFTRDPPLPVFPVPGTVKEPSEPNAKIWSKGNETICRPSKKRTRIRPCANSQFLDHNIPFGPAGGSNKFYGTPAEPVGGGGAAPCAVVVIVCGGGVAVYHFKQGDDPGWTLARQTWPAGCRAIVCGGDNSTESNQLHDAVLAALPKTGVTVDCVSGASSCGVMPDGTWYTNRERAGIISR